MEPDFYVSKAVKHRRNADHETPDLFSSAPPQPKREPIVDAPYQTGSRTSHIAAKEIAPRGGELREKVLGVIKHAGSRGATRKEIEEATGLLTQTVCPRLVELEEAKSIRKMTEIINGELKPVRRNNCVCYRIRRPEETA